MSQHMNDEIDAIAPIEEIIEEARNGRMFILVDAEDRENEGDLVIPGQFATPEQVNFMALHGRGLICLAITRQRSDALGLAPMARRNTERHTTAFTVSIEAAEGVTTGISAHDRARTISVAIDPTTGPEDIVTPGHVFPLVAREGGVLVRAGHTEAGVDISRLAGLNPSAVICEIMNEDGTMARLPELVAFARRHGMKIGAIEDLIAHRRRNDRYVERVLETDLRAQGAGSFRTIIYRNTLDGAEHVALVKGAGAEPGKPTLVRMHRIDFASDVLLADTGRSGLIGEAMRALDQEGAGVLVLIRETRQASLSERFGARPAQRDEEPSEDLIQRRLRTYGVGAQILLDLGVGDMVLLSDTDRNIVGLEGYGLRVIGRRPLAASGPYGDGREDGA